MIDAITSQIATSDVILTTNIKSQFDIEMLSGQKQDRGSFYNSIIESYKLADNNNARLLKMAFPHLFGEQTNLPLDWLLQYLRIQSSVIETLVFPTGELCIDFANWKYAHFFSECFYIKPRIYDNPESHHLFIKHWRKSMPE